MPSWEKLREMGARVGELLPGTWSLGDPPPYWLVILTRTDSLVRILIDDRLGGVVQVSNDDLPLPPLGVLPGDSKHRGRRWTVTEFKTRHRDPEKIASALARRFKLS